MGQATREVLDRPFEPAGLPGDLPGYLTAAHKETSCLVSTPRSLGRCVIANRSPSLFYPKRIHRTLGAKAALVKTLAQGLVKRALRKWEGSCHMFCWNRHG